MAGQIDGNDVAMPAQSIENWRPRAPAAAEAVDEQ
jgi:hypothetical protein